MQGRKRDSDIENGAVDTAGKKRVGQTERAALTYIRCHVQNRWLLGGCCGAQGAQLGSSRGVGCGVGGRLEREERYVCA